MSITLEISNKAVAEMDLSYNYYEEIQLGLGNKFITEVFNTIRYINKFPLHFRIFKNKFRQTKVHKFPFLVVYVYEQSLNKVIIISVFHTKRNEIHKV